MIHERNISYMLPVAEAFIRGFCFYRLIKPFMISAIIPRGIDIYAVNKKKCVSYVGAVYFLTMLFLYIIPLHMGVYKAYGIGSLIMFFFICWIDRRNYKQKAFLVVVFFSLNWFSAAMAEILYDNLYALIESMGYLRKYPEMSLVLYLGLCAFYLALEFGFTVLGIWQILRVYKNKSRDMKSKEMIMLALPSVVGIIAYKIIQKYRMFYIVGGGENKSAYDILIVMFYAVSVIAIIVVIVLYQDIKAKQEDELQNKLLITQIDSIERHIGQVEELYQDIRSIKHDMINHILILERLYSGNKSVEAKAYSTDLKTALCHMSEDIKSGNPVTDVILQELKNEAEKNGICFRSDFYYPSDSNINAFDVSVILSNALQNAMENVEKRESPYIAIRSYHRNNAYMIEIKNSFTGKLQWNSESGLPVTSKIEKDSHGYGLANIRKVAGKYSGDIAVDLIPGEFCLSIMLMMQ